MPKYPSYWITKHPDWEATDENNGYWTLKSEAKKPSIFLTPGDPDFLIIFFLACPDSLWLYFHMDNHELKELWVNSE